VFAASPDEIPTAAIDGKPTLVYWPICGLAQPIRLTLALAGVDFVDVHVDCGDPSGDAYKQMWFDKKVDVANAGVFFPNLPYLLLPDGVGLAQSNCILRHLGRVYNLMGPADKLHIADLVLEQMADFDQAITGRCYRDFAGLKQYCASSLPAQLEQFQKLLGDNKFVTGLRVSVADLKLYETLRKLVIIEAQPEIGSSTLAAYPALTAFVERVEALPALKAYMASEGFLARPLNNAHAQFK